MDRHPQVRAEHVDTRLPLLRPIIGQAPHRVHAGESDGRLVVTELGRRLLVTLGQGIGLDPPGDARGGLAVDAHRLLGRLRRAVGRCRAERRRLRRSSGLFDGLPRRSPQDHHRDDHADDDDQGSDDRRDRSPCAEIHVSSLAGPAGEPPPDGRLVGCRFPTYTWESRTVPRKLPGYSDKKLGTARPPTARSSREAVPVTKPCPLS